MDYNVVGRLWRISDQFPTKTKNLKSSEFRRPFPTNIRGNMARRNFPTTFRRHSDKTYNRCSRRKFVGIYRGTSDDIPINRYNRYRRRYSVGIFRRISDEPCFHRKSLAKYRWHSDDKGFHLNLEMSSVIHRNVPTTFRRTRQVRRNVVGIFRRITEDMCF